MGASTRAPDCQALHWATQLQAADPDNAFALALITDNARNTPHESKSDAQQQLKLANQGLAAIPKLVRPLGMSIADFSSLRQQSQAMLKGAAGAAELALKNYAAARQDLRDAIAIDPKDPRNLYALALADLDGKDPNVEEGYWYLARVVNLSKGTAQGAQIATYARNRYLQDGGNSAAWDQFLAAAAPVGADRERQTMLATSKPTAPATSAVSLKPVTRTTGAATRDVPAPSSARTKPAPSIWADDTPYTPPVKRKRQAVAGGPMSLGILIETSITSKENHNALVGGLTDMLRHLGDNDEAFILSYDNNLVFETDLTADPHQLEEALTDIKPQQGAVLVMRSHLHLVIFRASRRIPTDCC